MEPPPFGEGAASKKVSVSYSAEKVRLTSILVTATFPAVGETDT